MNLISLFCPGFRSVRKNSHASGILWYTECILRREDNMQFGFSYVGAIFLIMLLVPNLIWSKHKPVDYDKYVENENEYCGA